MPELKLDANTTVLQLQAFQQSVGNKDEIRARDNGDGTTTLYTHSSGKISLNRDPQKRAEKQQAAYTAVAGFLKDKFGDAADVGKLFGRLDQPLRATALDKAILDAAIHNGSYADMKSVLDAPELRAAFRTHLAGEFSLENLDFYEAVERFEIMVDDPHTSLFQIGKELDRIKTEYLDDSGSKTVNLPADVRNATRDSIKRLQEEIASQRKAVRVLEGENSGIRPAMREVLTAPKREIFRLMDGDSRNRFVSAASRGATDLFTPALQRKLQNDVAAERAHAIQESLRGAGLI